MKEVPEVQRVLRGSWFVEDSGLPLAVNTVKATQPFHEAGLKAAPFIEVVLANHVRFVGIRGVEIAIGLIVDSRRRGEINAVVVPYMMIQAINHCTCLKLGAEALEVGVIVDGSDIPTV